MVPDEQAKRKRDQNNYIILNISNFVNLYTACEFLQYNIQIPTWAAFFGSDNAQIAKTSIISQVTSVFTQSLYHILIASLAQNALSAYLVFISLNVYIKG